MLNSGGVHAPFNPAASLIKGEKFCLECCSQRQTQSSYTESWRFKCPIASEPTVQWDKFEHEFRFPVEMEPRFKEYLKQATPHAAPSLTPSLTPM